MDRERFDLLARLLATKGSRRGAFGALLGVALLGHEPEEVGSKAKGKKRGKGKSKGRGKSKNAARGGESAQQAARSGSCCGGAGDCTKPKPGDNNRYECDFSGDDLSGGSYDGANFGKIDGRGTNFNNSSLRGANFGGACLQNATFDGADVEAANFGKACLFGADFSGARNLNVSVKFSTALLCNTKLPGDDNVSNRDCNSPTNCCGGCSSDGDCGSGQVCCDRRCKDGECCAAADCDDKQCKTKSCTGNECDYATVQNGAGPLCGTICCSGVCCPDGVATCDKDNQCDRGCPTGYKKCGDKCIERDRCCTDGTPDKCPYGKKCCGGICIDENRCCTDNTPDKCPYGKKCCGGQCIAENICCTNGYPDSCPEGKQCCGGECIDKDVCCTDNRPGCPDGKKCCGGECIDRDRCCPACPEGQKCLGGTCCPDNRVCGLKCLPAPCSTDDCLICDAAAGTCITTCKEGFKCCGGRCIEKDRCCGGGVPDRCRDGEKCCGGECIDEKACCTNNAPGCPDGKKCCDGTCIDRERCCPACPEGQKCLGGTCCPDNRVCGSTCLPAPCDGDDCLKCDDRNGICISDCDPDLCEVCDGKGHCVVCPDGGTCVNGECKEVCGADTCDDDEVCCAGSCLDCPDTQYTRQRLAGNPRLCSGGVRVNPVAGQCRILTRNCPGGGTCQIEYCFSANGKELSFRPVEGQRPCRFDQVVVKGGPNAFRYTFEPDAVCAEGLVSPLNRGGNVPQISHVDFCGIGCC